MFLYISIFVICKISNRIFICLLMLKMTLVLFVLFILLSALLLRYIYKCSALIIQWHVFYYSQYSLLSLIYIKILKFPCTFKLWGLRDINNAKKRNHGILSSLGYFILQSLFMGKNIGENCASQAIVCEQYTSNYVVFQFFFPMSVCYLCIVKLLLEVY